jgi:hypothetical protein
MKKYKVSFSIFNLFEESSAKVVKLQGMIKAGAGLVATSAYVTSHQELATLTAIVGFVLDALAACLYFEEPK